MSLIEIGKEYSSKELAKLVNDANKPRIIELDQAKVDKLLADKNTTADEKELLAKNNNRVQFKPVNLQTLVTGGWIVGCWTAIGRGTEIIFQAGDGNSGALLGGFLGAALAIGIGGTTIGDLKIWRR